MQIFTTFTLSQIQTILTFILNVMGLGLFFFLSNAVKLRETIVPTTTTGVEAQRIKWTTPVAVTSMMVVLGLALTSFGGTINYAESCSTAIVKTQAKVTNEVQNSAAGAFAEVEAMMSKRNKSGVPSGILVGQIPEDNRWKYDASLDVNPYPWRSSCSLYKSGVIQVNMNTSVLHGLADIHQALPEVHTNYTFYNIPDGYNNYAVSFYIPFIYSNDTSIESTYGALFLHVEEFIRRGNIGMKYMNRLWTLRVPETIRIPYDRKISKIVSVPIVVKAYTCEMERVKEGDHGSYNILTNTFSDSLSTPGQLIGRKWTLAVMGGKDTSIYELTPEHWASYLAVKDTQTAQVEEVFARINIPCITVHSAYITLVCAHLLMFVVGAFSVLIRWREILSSVIEWVSFSSKESGADDKTKLGYNSGATSDNVLKIKLVKNLDVKEKGYH